MRETIWKKYPHFTDHKTEAREEMELSPELNSSWELTEISLLSDQRPVLFFFVREIFPIYFFSQCCFHCNLTLGRGKLPFK
jgi:hypothetical protein